jgi:hypothetical protein
LAVTLLFVEKSAKVMLNFGLDCGLLVFLYAIISRTIVDFLEHDSAEKIAVCAHTTHDPKKEDN